MKKLVAAIVLAGTMTAGTALADGPRGVTMLSDQEMDGIVGGAVITTTQLQTASGRTILLTRGPQDLLAADGPSNNGVVGFTDFDPMIPLPPGFSLSIDGTRVGVPSGPGRGALFLTVELTTP